MPRTVLVTGFLEEYRLRKLESHAGFTSVRADQQAVEKGSGR